MPEHIYDKGYKRLLSKKEYFLHFVKKYVQANWMQHVGPDDLTLINAAFVDETFREKEADIVYRVKSGDQEIVFYVLLELQSKVDYTMPFRLLVYMVELMKRLFSDVPRNVREKKDFRLPAVIPIVLYNGKQTWSAVQNFHDYIQMPESSSFNSNTIDFQYMLLDLMKQDTDYILNTNSALDDILYLDQGANDNDFLSSLKKVTQRAPDHTREDILEIWDWLMDILTSKVSNPQIIDGAKEALLKGDVEAMMTNVERIFDVKYQSGVAAGVAEGKVVIAKKLIRMQQFTASQISEITELPVKVIEELMNKESN